jgi:hypothetical protein
MEQITITVEDNLSDASFETLLSDSLTYLSGDFSLIAFGDTLRGSRNNSLTLKIVNSLYVDSLVAAEYRQTRTTCCTVNVLADAVLNLNSSFS